MKAPAEPRNPYATADDPRPFGAQTSRPRWPLVVLAVIFLAWCGVLVWLATTQVGMKF